MRAAWAYKYFLILCKSLTCLLISKVESSKFNKNSSEKVKSNTIKEDRIIPSSLLQVCKFFQFSFTRIFYDQKKVNKQLKFFK